MNPVIGKAVDRVDGRLKVTGGAHYCAEMPIPNLVQAVLINSAIALPESDRRGLYQKSIFIYGYIQRYTHI
ncbi:MAG: hypothetical protein V7K71_29635 [Nostoc sp.]|uniref:hypothetical protein n=1 Tax=Nostoc sp. TaxID=1180 RepID=UPI002FFB411B